MLVGVGAWIAMAALAPAAGATISPTVTLDQSAGTKAGSTVPLGMDLKFAPSLGDSPKDLTLVLPPGLLANASINGGACLRTSTPTSACQVGSGTVTAAGLSLLPVSLPVQFDLVAPPKAGDLAGLALVVLGSQLGTPGEITVRSGGNPAGVGLNIAFSAIPNTYFGLPIAVDELQSTFSGLRLPTSCPATAASVAVSADAHNDPAQRSASAPLQVTGCSGLAYSPAFHVTAVRDTADTGVQITTDITQPTTPVQATSRTVALTLPPAVFTPNVVAVLGGGILCANPSSGACKTIGTARAVSPLYPSALTGKAYLTGTLASPAITLVLGPPFALTLNGGVALPTNTTTFQNVPDIPLTDLQVVLTGGANSAFIASCAQESGVATSTLTSQNRDRTAAVSSPFTVSGCPPSSGPPPVTGGGTPPANVPPTKGRTPGRPHAGSTSLTGLAHGSPTLSFKLSAGANAPKLGSFTVQLPSGLSFHAQRAHRRLTFRGLTVKGAKVRSIALTHGRLVVTLSRPAAGVTVTIRAPTLTESGGLRTKARRHRAPRLLLTLIVTDAAGTHTKVTLTAA
jgi:hypothetical protein